MEFLSATKLIQDALCPFRRKHEKFEDGDHLKFGKSVDSGVSLWVRGADFMEEFSKKAAELNLPLSEDYLARAEKCFLTLADADKEWLKLNRENIITVQSDDGEAEYYGNKFFEVPIGKDWGLRGAIDYADHFCISDQGDRIDDLYDFNRIKKHIIRIIDWKTGFSDADDLQTAIYALASWMKYEYLRTIYEEQGIETVIQTRFFYLDQGGKSPKRYWNKNTLTAAFYYIKQRVEEFRKRKDFPRKLNKLCYCCNLAADCPVYQKALKETPVVQGIEKTQENLPVIIERLEEISAIKKIVEKAERELKTAQTELLLPAGKQGVVVGDRVYTATEYTTKYDYDLAGIFEQASELLDRPPFEIMKFDSGAFDNLVKLQDDKVIKKALQQLKKDRATPAGTAVRVTSKINQTPDEVTEEEKPAKADDISDAEIVQEPVADSVNPNNWHQKMAERARASKALPAFVCEDCGAIMVEVKCDGCKECLSPSLVKYQSFEDAKQSVVPGRDKKVFICTNCGCAADVEAEDPGQCRFCKKHGPWKVVDKYEASRVQREIVATASIKTQEIGEEGNG